MGRTISELLAQQPSSPDAARHAALARLMTALQPSGPVVTWVHGGAGVGKSRLLKAFGEQAAQAGTSVLRLDCGTIEPTPAGMIAALGKSLQLPEATDDAAAHALSGHAAQSVLMLERYESFRLADTWLRREFIPRLRDTARVVLSSREPPSAGWVGASEWRPYFLELALAAESPPRQLGNMPANLRRAMEVCSVIRRVTRPMFTALVPGADAESLYEQFSALPVVERRSDGLELLEPLRLQLCRQFQASDPVGYRDSQRRAWRLLHRQLQHSARADLWRCTADIIYLIENPVVREAFFPSQSSRYSVEPARPADHAAVMAIASKHEPPESVAALELWWLQLPEAFHVVRDASGEAVGFYCLAKPRDLAGDWMQTDPVARHWQRHLQGNARTGAPSALFLRRWLSLDDGEQPSAIQAAAWIDIKRTYLELRPELRRVYLTVQDLGPYAQVATQLGFKVLPELAAPLGATTYHSAMLDFGPGSVDGWISGLVATELGISDDELLDVASRELVVNGERIALTPLEFGLLAMLQGRAGKPVARDDLLRQVWGHGHQGGSNVVDVVVRGLRRKLGDRADLLQTVRGVGYRLLQSS